MKRAKAINRTLLPVLVMTTLFCLLTQILLPASALAYEDKLPTKDFERALPGDPDTPIGFTAGVFVAESQDQEAPSGHFIVTIIRMLSFF